MQSENTSKDNAAQLRKRLRQARSALSAADRQRGGLLMRGRLYTWLGLRRDAQLRQGRPAPQVVAAYWPLPDEPDLRPLLTQWADAGITVALPVVHERDAPLLFRAWTPDAPMAPGAYGIPEPVSGETVTPDVVLVPTLGYTASADRLGYGGGYYDRTLAALREAGHAPVTIGIAWHCGLIDQVDYRPAPHDVRLDAVLTPRGWVPAAP
jgi:5,10-methenyltetrahydrofolate synthetase